MKYEITTRPQRRRQRVSAPSARRCAICCRFDAIFPEGLPDGWAALVQRAGFQITGRYNLTGVTTMYFTRPFPHPEIENRKVTLTAYISRKPQTLGLQIAPSIANHDEYEHAQALFPAAVIFKLIHILGGMGKPLRFVQCSIYLSTSPDCARDNELLEPDKYSDTRLLAEYPERPIHSDTPCFWFRTLMVQGIPIEREVGDLKQNQDLDVLVTNGG